MEESKMQTVNTYTHRQQDSVMNMIAVEPAAHPRAASRLREYLLGGREKCLEK